jgi:hypothetical protein
MYEILICYSSRVVAAALLVVGLSHGPANSATYTYTGNNFNSTTDTLEIAGAYDLNMKISGSFTLASPLVADLFEQNIFADVLAFSFSDGRNTLTSLNTNSVLSFQVSTDASGNITDWVINLQNEPMPPSGLGGLPLVGAQFFQIWTTLGFDRGFISECRSNFGSPPACTNFVYQESGRYDSTLPFTPGTWAVSDVSPVPLPPSIVLQLTGLALVSLLAWRGKRRASALAGN